MRKLWKSLIFLGVFFVGFLSGCILVGALSVNASRTFLKVAKTSYKQQQELLGDQALKRGNPMRAWMHYENVVEIPGVRSKGAVDPWMIEWTLSFPVAALILNKIGENADPAGRGKACEEGIIRGKLGLALENLGRAEEARQEYARAANIMGMGDGGVERIRRLAEGILNATGRP